MQPLSALGLLEVVQECPIFVLTPDGRRVEPRATEGCWDFGDWATVGEILCVGGDETYRGVFLGHCLRLGYIVGVINQTEPKSGEPVKFVCGEAFKTREDMHGRWLLE